MAVCSEPVEPDFQKYFASISKKYKCWGNFYTLTDTLDRQSQDKAGFSSFDSPFDFGLMVEKFVPKQDKEEKRDRLPVLEGICKYLAESNHVLLIGKPGSGKSTALNRLLLEKCRDAIHRVSQSGELPQIPVLIELRYWQSSVFQLIEAFFNQHELPLTENEIKSLLSQRKLLLLVDGLNELPSEEARRQIAAFRGEFSQTPMIFTTRDLGIGGDLGIEKKLEMLPLTELQMRQFVLTYLPEQGEELLRQLRDRVREFGQTPLLLWMLCELFRQRNSIPANLGMVFRLFTQGYENRVKQDVPIKSDRNWWKPLLEYLAFVMMQGEPATEFRVTIPKQEVKMVFQQFLQGKVAYADDFALRCLDDLLNHHLIEVGSGEQIQFRHQLLQEYYAAESLLRLLPSLSDRKLQRDYLNLLKWTQSIAIALALLDNKAQAVHIVMLALDVDLMLGARLAGEVKEEFQEKTVEFILKLDIREKLRVEFLGLTRSKFALDTIISILNNGSSLAHILTIDALEKIGGDRVIDTLIIALNNEDAFVRINALQALGNIGNNKAVIPIISLLNDEHAWFRIIAVQVLGIIGDKRAINFLTCSLDDEDSDVRYFAQDSLIKLENINSIVSFKSKQDYYLQKPGVLSYEGYEDFEIIYNPETEEEEIILIEKDLSNNYSYDTKELEYFMTLFKDEYRYFTSDYSEQVRLLKNNASSAILCSLWKVLLSEVDEAKDIILRIQERYKFYNHEIFHSPPLVEETENKSQATTTNNFYGEVGIVNTGKVDIHGNQIGLQNDKSIQ
jgi:predicted NACHT family NTPase